MSKTLQTLTSIFKFSTTATHYEDFDETEPIDTDILAEFAANPILPTKSNHVDHPSWTDDAAAITTQPNVDEDTNFVKLSQIDDAAFAATSQEESVGEAESDDSKDSDFAVSVKKKVIRRHRQNSPPNDTLMVDKEEHHEGSRQKKKKAVFYDDGSEDDSDTNQNDKKVAANLNELALLVDEESRDAAEPLATFSEDDITAEKEIDALQEEFDNNQLAVDGEENDDIDVDGDLGLIYAQTKRIAHIGKKGAARKSKTIAQESMRAKLEMQAETQRIERETTIRLPRFEPQSVDLDSFLKTDAADEECNNIYPAKRYQMNSINAAARFGSEKITILDTKRVSKARIRQWHEQFMQKYGAGDGDGADEDDNSPKSKDDENVGDDKEEKQTKMEAEPVASAGDADAKSAEETAQTKLIAEDDAEIADCKADDDEKIIEEDDDEADDEELSEEEEEEPYILPVVNFKPKTSSDNDDDVENNADAENDDDDDDEPLKAVRKRANNKKIFAKRKLFDDDTNDAEAQQADDEEENDDENTEDAENDDDADADDDQEDDDDADADSRSKSVPPITDDAVKSPSGPAQAALLPGNKKMKIDNFIDEEAELSDADNYEAGSDDERDEEHLTDEQLKEIEGMIDRDFNQTDEEVYAQILPLLKKQDEQLHRRMLRKLRDQLVEDEDLYNTSEEDLLQRKQRIFKWTSLLGDDADDGLNDAAKTSLRGKRSAAALKIDEVTNNDDEDARIQEDIAIARQRHVNKSDNNNSINVKPRGLRRRMDDAAGLDGATRRPASAAGMRASYRRSALGDDILSDENDDDEEKSKTAARKAEELERRFNINNNNVVDELIKTKLEAALQRRSGVSLHNIISNAAAATPEATVTEDGNDADFHQNGSRLATTARPSDLPLSSLLSTPKNDSKVARGSWLARNTNSLHRVNSVKYAEPQNYSLGLFQHISPQHQNNNRLHNLQALNNSGSVITKNGKRGITGPATTSPKTPVGASKRPRLNAGITPGSNSVKHGPKLLNMAIANNIMRTPGRQQQLSIAKLLKRKSGLDNFATP